MFKILIYTIAMAFAYMYFNLMDGKIIVYMCTCIYTGIVTVEIHENYCIYIGQPIIHIVKLQIDLLYHYFHRMFISFIEQIISVEDFDLYLTKDSEYLDFSKLQNLSTL